MPVGENRHKISPNSKWGIPIMIDSADKVINRELQAALTRDKRINLKKSALRIKTESHNVILEGSVEDIATKRITANIAREVLGDGYSIDDRLRIEGRELGDAELRDKVVTALLGEPVFRECSLSATRSGRTEVIRTGRSETNDLILVDTHEGVVRLSGQVNSLTHRRLAEALLWWIDGCQRVDNHLAVIPDEQDTDDELTDAVRILLEKDPLIDAAQIRVASHAGIVELGGQLSSEQLSEIAARDAWSIPDVWEVYNRIQVGHGLA